MPAVSVTATIKNSEIAAGTKTDKNKNCISLVIIWPAIYEVYRGDRCSRYSLCYDTELLHDETKAMVRTVRSI